MAVAAGHSRAMHLALQEGAVDEHFIIDLAVGVVEPGIQQGQVEVIQHFVPGPGPRKTGRAA